MCVGNDLISQDQLLDDGNGGFAWTASFYGYDGHGNVRYLTSVAGEVTDTYDYDAFGTLIAQTGTTPNSYLYCGEQFDADLDLYYNRARYLNVDTGRFWSRDVFEGMPSDPLSLHKYLYANSDPVNQIDPSGHFGTLVELNFVSAEQARDRGEKARRAYQGYQKVRKSLCKAGAAAIPNSHHALPMFLGGRNNNGNLVDLPENFHRDFHRLLHYMLRWVGLPGGYGKAASTYPELFQSKPSSRADVHKVLIKAAEIFDKECKGKAPRIAPTVRRQIKQGLWDF